MHKRNRLVKSAALLPDLLLLTDSALPTGGFSHSFGLETFISAGVDDIKGLLETYISEELGRLEGPAFTLAYRAAQNNELAKLIELDDTVNAMKIPREWREAGKQMGKRLIAIAGVINPQGACRVWSDYAQKVELAQTPGQYPVVAGIVYRMFGFPLFEGAVAYMVSSVKNLMGAAIRMIPLGQTEGLRLQNALHEQVMMGAEKAVMVISPEELGGFAPGIEMAGMRHECLYTRLFMS